MTCNPANDEKHAPAVPHYELSPEAVQAAHRLIQPYIHRTPVLRSSTLSALVSENLSKAGDAQQHCSTQPRVRLWFKCENLQRIGAFKARGAFHALAKAIDRLGLEELRRTGVVTHSSGNHAQALSLAARTYGIKANIVMPAISIPSKIAATRGYGAEVIFSGPTQHEREAVANKVIAETGAILVPPYDHPDIILGQGTMALELVDQVNEQQQQTGSSKRGLDAIVAPCGGGGMLSGIATATSGSGIAVYGVEPSFEGADDARRGLQQGKRIEKVSTLTIADGLRTPLGVIPWSVISDKDKVREVFSVDEKQIKSAMRLVVERMKMWIEPSAAVGLAALLYNEQFRELIGREAGDEGLDIGVILSGGNATLETMSALFDAEDN